MTAKFVGNHFSLQLCTSVPKDGSCAAGVGGTLEQSRAMEEAYSLSNDLDVPWNLLVITPKHWACIGLYWITVS